MTLVDRVAALLAPGGPIQRVMPGFEPREPQVRMACAVAQTLQRGGVLLVEAPTGCHARGQPILMYDGSVKYAEDVQVGDLLMGPDSRPRLVLGVSRGYGKLVRIVPRKGCPFVVNDDHVLSLVRSFGTKVQRTGGRGSHSTRLKGRIVDVTIRDWDCWSRYRKHIHKLFRVGVNFPDGRNELPLSPYCLGVWLGDGSLRHRLSVTTMDEEIIAACRAEMARSSRMEAVPLPRTHNAALRVVLRRQIRGRSPHPVSIALRQLGLWGVGPDTKFIPFAYRTAAWSNRAALLAGLLDTDGSYRRGVYHYITRSRTLAEDVAFVARSLGLAAYVNACEKRSPRGHTGTYYRVGLSGDLSRLPCRIWRKQAAPRRQHKDVLQTEFHVEDVAKGEYFGFALDGDGRYLLGDFTVTHNSGKGLAYLAALAAYLTRRREQTAIASTATITLQEQLVRKDLPAISEAAGGLPTALLKGMGRYVCLLKWRGLPQSLSVIPPADIGTFGRWVAATKTGDQNELPFVPSWWGEVAADHSDCLGSACSLQMQCFALRARDASRRAQLLVTNHHLLLLFRRFAVGPAALVPPDAPVVLDEGHHLSEIATDVFGESCTDFAFVALAQRLHGLVPPAQDPLHTQIDGTLVVHKHLMDTLRPRGFEPAPLPSTDPTTFEGYLQNLKTLTATLAGRGWEVIRDRSGTSANERAAILIRMLEGYTTTISAIFAPLPGTASWIEPVPQRNIKLVLRNAPIELGEALGGLFGDGAPPAILCSATLAAGGSFAHLKAKLGIRQARELILPPVFNYARQIRYYLPRIPLDPKAKTFIDQVAAELLALLRASEGRALVLFTSYDQLRAVAEQLRGKLPYTLLVQDQNSTTQLLQQFREDVHSVLLATARFWEGVDIVGPSLSLLVICRLPFDVPTHPLARARFGAAKARGENPFATVAVPEAIIKLRQGVGRLIRSTSDRGVVAILDGRVLSKSYGRRFMNAIPAAPQLSSHDEVAAFLRPTPWSAARRG